MSNIPSPGDRIGDRYRVVRLIGEGGMGAVFEAENVITHKRVALKWLHPAIASRAESAQRLIREAQAASRVRHPNVVDVYDVINHDGTIFLVLELLEGEPLHDVIESSGMKVPDFIGLVLQAMRGVAAAHAQGVIHRDVHPGNIFLERSSPRTAPAVKVLDFGISKLDGEASQPLTQSGTTIGTPLYMSYEQLCAVRDLDVRADIYSFGVILYRAITGQYPYYADSLPELAVQFVANRPESVKTLRREIPRALDRLIMACVARDREQRPATLEALIDALEPFASEDSFRALLSGQHTQIPTLVRARPATRLHAEGASLVPPTSVAPATPAWPATPPQRNAAGPVRAAHTPLPAAQRGARWGVLAAVGAVLLSLVAGAALLLARPDSRAEAEVKPPERPPAAVPAVPSPPPAPAPTPPVHVDPPMPPKPAPEPSKLKVKAKTRPPPAPVADKDDVYRRSVGGLKPEDFK